MPRYFTLQEAERLLPKLDEGMRKALHLKQEHDKAEEELNLLLRQVMVAGGMLLDRRNLLARRGRRDATAMRLNEVVQELQENGVQIKDLDMGLVDFPTLLRGEEVLLCWRLGESSIEYWHGTEEGFRGRKRIDQEFLDNHRGDPVD
jgi:hypothetical protein